MLILDNFINKCSNPEFQIGLIGEIKSGKLTLINALFGNNLDAAEENVNWSNREN